MKAVITINMDNAAFGDGGEEEYNRATELGNVLERLQAQVETMAICRPGDHCLAVDSNGNTIGRLVIQEGK